MQRHLVEESAAKLSEKRWKLEVLVRFWNAGSHPNPQLNNENSWLERECTDFHVLLTQPG